MNKLIALLGMAAVAAAVAIGVLVWSGSGTTEAAKPTVSIADVNLLDAGSCDLTTQVTWHGTKFLHRNGKIQVTLSKVGVGQVGSAVIDIPKGTVATPGAPMDEFHSWGTQSSGSYETRAIIFQSRGKDGAFLGKQLTGTFAKGLPVCP